MGEEAKQQAEAKPDEKAVEEKKEEKPAEEKPAEEEKKEEKPAPPPPPPQPFVLFVDLHCVGCAKKIEKSIMKMKGVEGVMIDMEKNEVTIKGIVEPQAICSKIMKRTKRRAEVISPLPAAEGEPIPQVVTSQVDEPVTVELNVNMHCEACAEQLKRKILKMRGVQTAMTELSTGKVTVTGTMDANKLVDYVYRRTRKQAKIVPRPQPESEKKEEAAKGDAAAEKPAAEEAKPEEKKEEEKPPAESKEEGKEEATKEGDQEQNNEVIINNYVVDDEGTKRMMMYNYYYQPFYVIQRTPPPQLFSDENPNACCIS